MSKNLTSTRDFLAALTRAGIIKEGDAVRYVTISASAYEPYVEIEIEYLADKRLADAIDDMPISERTFADPPNKD